MRIHLPPLRKRGDCLRLLAEHFVWLFGRELNKDVRQISSEAMEILNRYPWPGNVRELRNVLERGLTMGEETGLLDADAIFKVLPRKSGRLQPVGAAQPARPLAQVLAEAELQAIEAALVASRGNRSRAARILGISRSALYEKLNKLS